MMRNVLEYLEKTAPLYPDKVAYSNGTDDVTFRDVSEKARRIGTFLAKRGYANEPVVVFMEKHPRMVVSFFGTVYAGCYYVPLDEEMPLFRVELILSTFSPRVCICDEKTKTIIEKLLEERKTNENAPSEKNDAAMAVFTYEEATEEPLDTDVLTRIRRKQIDTDPLYVVFTSGSTGIPKGVVACHRSVIDYIENLSDCLGFSSETVFGSQTPLYFDACLKELYPTLKFGATTYLIPKTLFLFPMKLVDYLNDHKINTICWVVSALTMISGFRVLEKNKPKYLKTIAFGSEVFPIRQFHLWREALPDARFTNLYGPTEATGMSCFYHVERTFTEDETIPIGEPFPNTDLLLLGEDGKEAAPGEAGEICLRGTCVTLGYYRNPEKTKEVYVQNPKNDAYPEPIYKTGDIGRYNERGELVYLARKDFQIKHMGHRIELPEIEIVAAMHEQVAQTACVFEKEKERITLFYTGDAESKELTRFLKEKLPRYMVPNRITNLERMPLTPNGKIDRKDLLRRAENA